MKTRFADSVRSSLEEVERLESLFDWTIRGVQIWPLIRFRLYYVLAQRVGTLDEPAARLRSPATVTRHLASYLLHTLLRNPVYLSAHETLLVPNPRTVLANGWIWDGYTPPTMVRDPGVAILEKSNFHRHAAGRRKGPRHVAYLDGYEILASLSSGRRVHFCSTDSRRISRIESLLDAKLGTGKVGLERMIAKAIRRFEAQRLLYSVVLRRVKPKRVCIVVSYTNQGLVAAAKTMGIPVTEYQHGVMHKSHLAYHYGHVPRPEIDTFPDEIRTFGRFWHEVVAFPNQALRLTPYGYTRFRRQRAQLSSGEHKPSTTNMVLFVSQGTIGPKLWGVARAVASAMPSKEIVFRPHPSEVTRHYRTPVSGNLRIDCASSVYDSIILADAVIGAYSTVMYEAVALGVRTISYGPLANCAVEPLVDAGVVELAWTISDVERLLSIDATAQPVLQELF